MLQPLVGPLCKQDVQGKNTHGGTKALYSLAISIGVRRYLYASSVKNNNKIKMNSYNHLYLLLPTLPLWQGKETWPKAPLIGVHHGIYASSVKNNYKSKFDLL